MRIGIDVRCLAEGRRTGVEEYTLNLLENLFRLDSKNEYILFFNSYRASKACFGWIYQYPNVKLKVFRLPNKLLNFSFWYFGWPKIDKIIGGTDVFFMPNIIFGSISNKTRLIVTIHDLSFERFPEAFSWKRRLWHLFINPKKICQRADKIISVSESTKNDLLSLYRIDPKKIKLLYNGIAEKFKPIDRNDENLVKVKEKYKLPYKFILYLSTIEPRKNIIGIVRAYNYLQEYAQKNNIAEFKKYKLVIAGQAGWLSQPILSAIKKSAFKKDILKIDFIDDADKEYFLNLASLFLYPSFFEGFGFPPLEAMRCGIPVISSNNSSLPETIGRAGLLIDPDRPDEIFEALKEILTNDNLRHTLSKNGYEKSLAFSWQKTAEELLKVITQIKK